MAAAAPEMTASVTPIGAGRRRMTLVKGAKAETARRTYRQVAADYRRWWLHTTNPPNLGVWWYTRTPTRIPADDTRLRIAWQVDFWLTGTLLMGLGTAAFLAAAGLRWIACHPARRWTFLLTCTASLALWLA